MAAVLVATAFASRPPMASRELANIAAAAVVPIDVDRDGTDELYCLNAGEHGIRDQHGAIRWRSEESIPGLIPGAPYLAADVSGDGTPEVVIVGADRESTYVYWFDLTTRKMRHCMLDSSRDRGRVVALAAADVNDDWFNELLIGIKGGGRSRFDRVCMLNCREGVQLWSAAVEPGIWRLLVDDVDEDGFLEILVGILTPQTRPGTRSELSDNSVMSLDSAARIICLDHRGKEQWRYRTRSPASERRAASFGVAHAMREGLAVPVVLDRSAVAGAEPDVLCVLNGADGRIVLESAQLKRARLVQLVVDDLDGDDMPEVVTSDSRGEIDIRDISLKPLRSAVLGDIVDSVGVAVVPGLPMRQLFAKQAHAVTVLDSRLKVLCQVTCSARVASAVPLRAGRGKPVGLLVRDADADAAGRGIYRVEGLTMLPKPFPWIPALAGLFVVLLASAAVVVYTNAFHTAALRRLSSRVVETAGIAVLDRSGRLAPVDGRARLLLADYARDNRLHINDLLERPEFEPLRAALDMIRSGRMRTARCEVMLVVDRMPRAYWVTVSASLFGSCLLAFEDLSAVEYVRHIREWGPVAQRMAHGIKNPLTAMSLTLQRMGRDCPPDTREQIASMMDDIDRLRRMTDGLMRFVKLEPPRLAREDLNAVVRSCLNKPGSTRPEGITVELALSDRLPLVPLDRTQLCSALDNLLGNAVAAMGERGTLRISTETVEPRRPTDRRRAVLKIQDTGRGIPERYLERLFEPYFSLRPGGTGLGMCIAKRIIEDHKGSIGVESIEGKGTSVTITLPVESV